jgi:hypothetical protein
VCSERAAGAGWLLAGCLRGAPTVHPPELPRSPIKPESNFRLQTSIGAIQDRGDASTVLLRPAAVLPPMGKRRKRRHAAVVVEELDEDELQHRQPPHQEERKKKRRVAAVPSPASPPLGAAPPVQRQAAQFLAQLAPGLGCSLGACRVEGASCSAHRGPAHEPCTSCGHAATLHELELGRRSKQLVGLGGAAWLLLRARAAIVQLGSFAWCDALVRAAQAAAPQALGMSESEMLLDAAHNDDFSALQRMLDGGGGGGGGESAAQQPSPREVVRWWRHHNAAGGSGHVSDGEDMECVVRLACEIDALWFRLHYHTATESPMELAGSSTSNAHGVPTHGEWVARAVGATLDSSLLGGSAKQRRVIAAQVGALGAAILMRRGAPGAAPTSMGWSWPPCCDAVWMLPSSVRRGPYGAGAPALHMIRLHLVLVLLLLLSTWRTS